jgi:hypothetical protein
VSCSSLALISLLQLFKVILGFLDACKLRLKTAEVAKLRNKTRRLSDTYLDLDLLDTQARERLGMMRADEIIVR